MAAAWMGQRSNGEAETWLDSQTTVSRTGSRNGRDFLPAISRSLRHFMTFLRYEPNLVPGDSTVLLRFEAHYLLFSLTI